MKFIKKIFQSNTLYYPGCLTKFALPEILDGYKEILDQEGIDFITLSDKELCCGSPVKNAGAEKEFEKLAQKNLEVFKQHSIGKIITNCPACAVVFKKDYQKILGNKWEIEVSHISEIIEKSLPKIKKMKGKCTYHDSCHLGRELKIYDQPRRIIEKCGWQIVEPILTRENSFCCGGGGGVNSNYQDLSEKIAQDRIDILRNTEVEMAITACPMCYLNLRNNANEKIEIKELSQIILNK